MSSPRIFTTDAPSQDPYISRLNRVIEENVNAAVAAAMKRSRDAGEMPGAPPPGASPGLTDDELNALKALAAMAPEIVAIVQAKAAAPPPAKTGDSAPRVLSLSERITQHQRGEPKPYKYQTVAERIAEFQRNQRNGGDAA